MFIGRYYHHLEAKGRLAVPLAFRRQLKFGGVITRGLDGCLFLFPQSYWKQLSKKLASLPLTNPTARNFIRLLVQEASLLALDSQGRTLLPTFLIQAANLKKQVVFAGSLNHIEIWDKDTYHSHFDSLTTDPALLGQISDLNL